MTTSEALYKMAKDGNFPIALRDNARTFIYLPTEECLSVDEHFCIDRNPGVFVTPEAIRSPAMLMRRTNDMCTVWWVWMDGALHGQFSTEQEAREAALA